ncbi:MAG: DUF4433 domain-containing protein, partial [Hymenobacter sp.]
NLMVFRIEHVDNLAHILQNGMFTKAHASVNPNHVFIGHAQLTATRDAWPVLPCDVVSPDSYGTLGEYVPFYFGPRSPMLYVIKNGYQGVPQRSQRDIVYLCCRFRTIEESGVQFAFTDGHAKNSVTAFYGQPTNLDKLYWEAIYAGRWKNTEDDLDRERRKQAEMLVYNHVFPEWIEAVVVYDDAVRTFAQNIIQQTNHKAVVRVNPWQAFNGCGFYYP